MTNDLVLQCMIHNYFSLAWAVLFMKSRGIMIMIFEELKMAHVCVTEQEKMYGMGE